MAPFRIRRVRTPQELEAARDDVITQGYEMPQEGETTVLARRRTWGSTRNHVIIGLLTIWWTLGIANLIYALVAHHHAGQVITRRQRWGWASLLVIGFVLLGVGLANEPRAQPYNGIDATRYTTLTCGEWLAAPSAQQVGWAELDKAVMLRLAATDAAKANIASDSVQDWVGLTTDACLTESASTLAFTYP